MSDQNPTIDRVRFVYEKARHHRTFHADGAWAGITPRAEVQFAFFNDLRPMPSETIHSVTAEGVMGNEISRVHTSNDIVRETDVTVVMNKEAVKSFIKLLETMVEQAEKQTVKDAESKDDTKVS